MHLSGPHLPSNMFSIPQAELCAARLGKTSSHPAHGRAVIHNHVLADWGKCHRTDPLSLAVTRKQLPLTYLKEKKRRKKNKKEKKGERKEEKKLQPADHIHHYHNWRRSWLVDDWFMSSCRKPKREREDRNILIYLFLSAAGGSPKRWWRSQFRLIHGRLLSACHKSSHSDTHFFLNWSTPSLCTTCSFLITDRN